MIPEVMLSFSAHSVNNASGLRGLALTLFVLVLGTLPKFLICSLKNAHPGQKDRFEAMKLAQKEFLAFYEKFRISEALKSWKSPGQQLFLLKKGKIFLSFARAQGSSQVLILCTNMINAWLPLLRLSMVLAVPITLSHL